MPHLLYFFQHEACFAPYRARRRVRRWHLFTVYYFDQLVTALGLVLGVKEISSQTAFG